MVFIVDAEGTFDAPIDKIWRFMQSPPDSHSHPGNMNLQMEEQGEHMILSFENEMPGAGRVKQKIKTTVFPPVGITMEYLEGPIAGSKMMQYYYPKGNKTDVVVAGEFTSKMVPEAQLRGMVLKNLEKMFNDDQENLKRFK
jgi:hypothetical protein